jgi:hypothetical protein
VGGSGASGTAVEPVAVGVAGLRRRDARLPRDVGGQPREVRTGVAVGVVAALCRGAAAVLHAQELVDALVELVVAHAGDVEAHGVERLDRRLVLEQAGHDRARADEVAGGDGHAVPLAGAQGVELRGQVGRAAVQRGAGAGEGRVAARGRLDVPVVVVERQDLQVDQRRLGRRGRRDRRGGDKCAGCSGSDER